MLGDAKSSVRDVHRSYAALCAAFTAPIMQLEIDLASFRSGTVFSLAWDAVVQNVSGVVVLVIVDLLLFPRRASKLAVASLHQVSWV